MNDQEEVNIRLHPMLLHRVKARGGTLMYALILTLICPLAAAVSVAKDKPPVQYQIPIPAPPDFSVLDWLSGQWAGKTLPSSPPGDVQLSVSSDLEKRVLVFRGEISLGTTPTAPAARESWLGILSASDVRTGFTLRVFSSMGFITRYRLTMEGAEIQLNPEGGDSPPAGWLFRTSWVRTGPGELMETVQAAPPGKTFFNYYAAKLVRVPPPEKTTSAP